MQPLSGLDSAFLYAENANTPMNVIGVVVLAPVRGKRLGYEELVARVEARLPHLTPFRRRLLETPLGLGHPVWVEDPRLEVRRHVRRTQARAPGSRRELAEVVADIAGRRLDRSRPLWALWLVEGLERGRVALVFCVHHAAADGVSGAALLLHLVDGAHADSGERSAVGAAPLPSRRRLLTSGLRRTLQPGSVAHTLADLGRSALGLSRHAFESDPAHRAAALPFTAPRTSFNRAISPRRSVAYARTSLTEIARVRSAFGGSVNDVVMAACTAALRRYLRSRGELPDRPLVAAVPVSIRDFARDGGCGNRISAMLVGLPVQLEDPLHRLAEVRRASRGAKHLHRALGSETIGSLAELLSPPLTRAGTRLYSAWKLADRHRPVYNLTISNVPGPSRPLFLGGARALAVHPHGPIFDGAGVNITVLSYDGSVDVGVVACRRLVPEAEGIADGFAVGVAELAELAGAGSRWAAAPAA